MSLVYTVWVTYSTQYEVTISLEYSYQLQRMHSDLPHTTQPPPYLDWLGYPVAVANGYSRQALMQQMLASPRKGWGYASCHLDWPVNSPSHLWACTHRLCQLPLRTAILPPGWLRGFQQLLPLCQNNNPRSPPSPLQTPHCSWHCDDNRLSLDLKKWWHQIE